MDMITVKCKLTAGFIPDLGIALIEGELVTIPADRFTDELFEMVPDPQDSPAEKTKKK